MGGLWVDYELMTSIPGLFAIGEANFSDHGANRLGASALMQGLADGYFVLPYTIQNYLSDQIQVPRFSTDLPEFVEAEKAIKDRIQKLMNVKGKETVDTIHRKLGHIMWEHIGMARDAKRFARSYPDAERLEERVLEQRIHPRQRRQLEYRVRESITCSRLYRDRYIDGTRCFGPR